MKLKKLFVTFTLLLTAFVSLFAATACGEVHTHTFSAWETVSEPTCTAFGLQKRTCECGQVEYETQAAVEHTPVVDESVAATCTEFGKTEGSHCGECGMILVAQTQTAKLSHDFSAWETVSEPTCTAFGLQKRTCECGQVEYETKAALEHNPVVDESVAATCTEFGKTEGSHCDTCGVVFVAQSSIAPIGHNCNEITVLEEAYCNLDGCKRYSCSNAGCDYYYDESYALPELDGSVIYANALQYTGIIQVYNYLGHYIREASAFVISEDGKIATSNLVLDNASSAQFILNGEYYDVTDVLAYSTTSHVAVLKIDADNLPYANLCKRDPVEAEKVYVVGSPDGYDFSIVSGIISNPKRVDYEANYIQHDADMKDVHIGGPLLNRFGEVIGINIGYSSSFALKLAAWVAELDELDYSTPISMEEYGDRTYSPIEYLMSFALNNYNEVQGSLVAYVLQSDNFYYALGCETEVGYAFVEGSWKDQNYQYYTGLIIDNTSGTYTYYASLTDGVWKNEVRGYIDAATYDGTEILTYDTYYGRYWTESDLMELYTTALYDTLEFFSYCLDAYFTKITLETFGFTALSYDKDEEALDKLNSFIQNNGALDETTGAYVVSGSTSFGEDTMEFSISYVAETEDVASSTVVNVNYYTKGARYSATLLLNSTENGHRFDFMYALYDGTEYVAQNVAWGYIEAETFTRFSTLYCYEFTGMGEYEDALLVDYMSFLDYIMGLLNNSVMPLISPELSVADLGFLFYFG